MLHRNGMHWREPFVHKENIWIIGMITAIAVPVAVQAQDDIVLDPIIVEGQADKQDGAGLPQPVITGSSEGAGATTVGSEGVCIRTDGSGDANTALTSLPRVQYRNDADTDAGENSDDVLDFKPPTQLG